MKRLASVLALLGCILHATLLPWHAAARIPVNVTSAGIVTAAIAASDTDAAQLAQDLQIICHSDGTGVLDGRASQRAPSEQAPECQICKGLAGFQLVVLAAAELGLLAPLPSAVVTSLAHDELRDGIAIAPRSRGPPLSI